MVSSGLPCHVIISFDVVLCNVLWQISWSELNSNKRKWGEFILTSFNLSHNARINGNIEQETIPAPCGAKLPTSATHFVNKNLVFSPSCFSLNENQVSLQWSNLEIISTHNFLGGSYLLNICLSTGLHNQDLCAKALWVRANEQQQHCHVMCTIQQYY